PCWSGPASYACVGPGREMYERSNTTRYKLQETCENAWIQTWPIHVPETVLNQKIRFHREGADPIGLRYGPSGGAIAALHESALPIHPLRAR
ncbi:MAG TPA: hypothetical protein VGO93_01750, partial [Candidatus Xenobia bacterium]